MKLKVMQDDGVVEGETLSRRQRSYLLTEKEPEQLFADRDAFLIDHSRRVGEDA